MSIVPNTEVHDPVRGDPAALLKALLHSEPLPMIQKLIAAFRRELPELLNQHRGSWVAYHGDERIGFGETQTWLYEECFRRGLTRDEFVVCGIEEGAFDPAEEIEMTSDI